MCIFSCYRRTMKTNYYLAAAIALLFSFLSQAQHNHVDDSLELLVFKTPTCGCCKKWIDHIQEQGIISYSQDYADLTLVKNQFAIKPNYRSCHTAVTRNGFAFEGHVPAKFIKQFLNEKYENAIGLSVPAMPVGSPGMEVGERFMPYQVLILFKDGSSKVYAQVNTYEEQF
jgi:hypothetical protein